MGIVHHFIANLLLSPPVKVFGKSFTIWRSYEQEYVVSDSRGNFAAIRDRVKRVSVKYSGNSGDIIKMGCEFYTF